MAEKKEKKYVSDNAQLMAEWDWEKNNAIGLDPHKLVMGSHKYAFSCCIKEGGVRRARPEPAEAKTIQ